VAEMPQVHGRGDRAGKAAMHAMAGWALAGPADFSKAVFAWWPGLWRLAVSGPGRDWRPEGARGRGFRRP
jgi:hypothetical protein